MTAPTIRRAVGAAAAQQRKHDALIEDYEWLVETDPRIHDDVAARRLGVTPRTVDRIKAAIRARNDSVQQNGV